MYSFKFHRASSPADATAAFASMGDASFLAGGQTLLASLKLRLAQPDTLIDLGRIAELQGIRSSAGRLTIGSMTTHEEVQSSPAVVEAIPALAHLAGGIGDILGPGTLNDVTEDQFDRVMHVNCLAQILAIRAFSPSLKKSGGAIVNVASVGAQVGLPLMSVYCASKAAVVGMTRAVAAELAPLVRCNVVCPGGIDTPMAQGLLASVPQEQRDALLAKLTGRQLLPRFATPAEIAQVLVFLVSDESAFMTGSVVSADGGHTAW